MKLMSRFMTGGSAALVFMGLTLASASSHAGFFFKGPSSRYSIPSPECQRLIPPPTTGYGATGPYSVTTEELPNPRWRRYPITVFFPTGAKEKRPVIFFSHGFGQPGWAESYPGLIKNLVSQGYILVYSPYKTLARGGDNQEVRYDMLWGGFEDAVAKFGSSMDLSQVGFVGHSFGGGATPAMAHKGIVENGWGKNGAFMFIMAPWFSYNITQEQLNQFPRHTNLVIQVYSDDKINDHRMAIDLFDSFGIPEEHKDFVEIQSDHARGCDFVADHATPALENESVLKFYGIYRIVDALADYSFKGTPEGKAIALGHGSKQQTDMGKWPDGAPFRALIEAMKPAPKRPEDSFKFKWNSPENKRLRFESFR